MIFIYIHPLDYYDKQIFDETKIMPTQYSYIKKDYKTCTLVYTKR